MKGEINIFFGCHNSFTSIPFFIISKFIPDFFSHSNLGILLYDDSMVVVLIRFVYETYFYSGFIHIQT